MLALRLLMAVTGALILIAPPAVILTEPAALMATLILIAPPAVIPTEPKALITALVFMEPALAIKVLLPAAIPLVVRFPVEAV